VKVAIRLGREAGNDSLAFFATMAATSRGEVFLDDIV
jgi:hypothetical protein